jgi:hypothetical protein
LSSGKPADLAGQGCPVFSGLLEAEAPVLPELLSRFYGIVIAMFYNDHEPPHFHARYGRDKAIFAIADASLIRGEIPRPALQLVREWARLHRTELEDNWRRARHSEPLRPVDPLQ